ncbi:MAG: site-2 protease family protein, partial [Rudaea sp.]
VQINTAVGQPIGAVAPGSIADQAGLKPGDALVRVGSYPLIPPDGNGFTTHLPRVQDLAGYVQQNSLVPTIMPVYVIRDGKILPPLKIKIPEHVDSQQASLGLTLNSYRTAPEAVGDAVYQMGQAVSLLPRTLSGIASGIASGTDTGAAGPIRIAQAIAEGTPLGGLPFLIYLFGNISFSLAVFNLIPWPGLDGARILFLLLEVIRGGRRLDPKFEGVVNLVGLIFVFAFMIFVSYSDVLHVLSGKSAFTP